MASRYYALLETKARTAAENWPMRRPTTAMPSHEFMRYNAAANQLLLDIERSVPFQGSEVVRDPAPIALQIMFRTCHIAALLAREDALPMDQLTEALRSDDTFGVIEPLLTTNNDVAVETARQIGLRSVRLPVNLDALKHWQIDSSVSVNAIEKIRAGVEQQKPPAEENVGCPAHKAKIVKPLFQSVITICERDQNLFTRSLR